MVGRVFAVSIALASPAFADTAMSSNTLVVDIPALQAPAPAAVAKPQDKLICRTSFETGSYVKRVRHCATAQEWRQSTTSARTWTSDIQDQKGRYDPTRMATDVYMTPGGKISVGN